MKCTGLEQRDLARRNAFDKGQELVGDISKTYKQLITSGRLILFALSQVPQIQEQNVTESAKIFTDLLAKTQDFINFVAVAPNGAAMASALPLDRSINFADRPWFQQAVNTKSFVIGDYLIDRISGKPVINLVYPVFDPRGQLKTVLYAGLDINWIHTDLGVDRLPQGSTLKVITREGNILFHHPHPEKFVGTSQSDSPIVKTMLANKEGREEAVDFDGERRFFVYASLGEGDEYLLVSIGLLPKVAFAEVNQMMLRSFIFLGFIGIFALGTALLFGQVFILQPISSLLTITNRLKNGDLLARTEFSYRHGEISQLAHAFDQMAEHLARREQALRESEKKFRGLFDHAPLGYHECDREGRITNVNLTELEMLGYTQEEMMGKFVWNFVVEEEKSRQTVLGKLTGLIPPSKSLERTFRRKDGTSFPGIIQDQLLLDKERQITGIRSTVQDISDRKQAEKEKEALQEQVRQSQKMEAIGRLAGGVAHDFNNLLTIIKGYSQLSLLAMKAGDPLKEHIEEVIKAADRAANLTRQLLAFSRRQVMEMQVLDLNEILRNLDKMLSRMIGEDIEMKTILADNLWKVRADPGQIDQVVMNLVVNARDAMPKGGKLTLETANIRLDEEYAGKHVAVTPGDYVMISVADTGTGMNPEVMERIFDPFFTTKEKGRGTGLGLSTVYGIVKQSNGNIWVYSEPGQGTVFKIYLPRVDEPADEIKERIAMPEFPWGKETILVVEDDEKVRKLAVKVLENHGYKVLEAESGNKALEICRGRKKPVHLVLTDVVMPEMDGRQLTKQLTQILPGFKVLYMSGYTDNAIAHHGIIEKGLNFIQKPLSIEGLLRKVREVLDK
jgi:PAS domain S-box-containing protein